MGYLYILYKYPIEMYLQMAVHGLFHTMAYRTMRTTFHMINYRINDILWYHERGIPPRDSPLSDDRNNSRKFFLQLF